MDFDLEIISEESDGPDPLFDSIINAMNSMKEATADKIYHKIQREGETNYSKPQVGRALASALKYGIFEIKNNQYRVRDDILDDKDTVYWELQKKREQTPFRIQDDVNEKQFGPKLNPERDNRRFKTVGNKVGKSQECPHCGRIKRLRRESTEQSRKLGSHRTPKKRRKQLDKERSKTVCNTGKRGIKRKACTKRIQQSLSEERCGKKRKGKKFIEKTQEKLPDNELKDAENQIQEEGFDSSDSEIDLVSPPSNEQSFKSGSEGSKTKYPNTKKQSRSIFSLECVDADEVKAKKSSTSSLKFDSECDQMDVNSFSFDQSRTEVFESLPCTSTNASHKTRNQYLGSTEMYRNHYERDQTDQCQEKSHWLRCSDEPQAKITHSNNGLTIQPIDSLAFKSPGQASYIS